MDAPPGLEHAVDAVEPGGRLLGVTPLTGGVSADVYRFDIETAAGRLRRVVVRRHRSAGSGPHGAVARQEVRLLGALRRAGLAVPAPLAHVDGGVAPYVVMEWVAGSTALAPAELGDGLDQMADFLVGLHALEPSSLAVDHLLPIEDPLRAMAGYLPATDAGRAVGAWLASDPPPAPAARRAVLHGDYWPGNVLWQDGRLAAVIDWEDASVGDPLADLATARVELACQYGDGAAERFTARYVAAHRSRIGRVPLDGLARWEVYASAAALATMAGWGLDPHDEARRRDRTTRWFTAAARRLR